MMNHSKDVDRVSPATRKGKNVAKIVIPVMVSVLVLTAAGIYLVWICKLRGGAKPRGRPAPRLKDKVDPAPGQLDPPAISPNCED
ncbi:hypothetical protein C2845_PM15G23080 [Panicum miliaceum]|uniref:Uncharacterized protein n=1 Tax=Panicum miliaceum TaxID=4540 RepID=A0A3L6QAR4_PANMI|nr:hypothetical protein C2845_PM15G23080 [Panicum miliaceum]